MNTCKDCKWWSVIKGASGLVHIPNVEEPLRIGNCFYYPPTTKTQPYTAENCFCSKWETDS